MKFSIKDFFSKYDQICIFLRIWSHLLEKFLMENVKFSDMVIVGNLGRGYHFINDVKNVVTDETRSGVHFISFKHKKFLKRTVH